MSPRDVSRDAIARWYEDVYERRDTRAARMCIRKPRKTGLTDGLRRGNFSAERFKEDLRHGTG